MLTYGIPPDFRGGVHLFISTRLYAIGSVPSLSGHAIAYRWRSLPRVRRHGASKPQGSSERVLPRQVIMDQLIFASLSHTHYWYEVGMLKVPAVYAIDIDIAMHPFFGGDSLRVSASFLLIPIISGILFCFVHSFIFIVLALLLFLSSR